MKHGPAPVFTETLIVKLRTDQKSTLQSLAAAMGLSVSELVRWIIDQGIEAVTEAWKETHG